MKTAVERYIARCAFYTHLFQTMGSMVKVARDPVGYRLIKMGRDYWQCSPDDDLIAINMAREKQYRLGHGREPRRAQKTARIWSIWQFDGYPDAVRSRTDRMRESF